jgi:hypothetical protein
MKIEYVAICCLDGVRYTEPGHSIHILWERNFWVKQNIVIYNIKLTADDRNVGTTKELETAIPDMRVTP